jgi:predicted PurR-regulated permease PerM
LLKQKSAEKLDEFQQFVIKQFGYSLNNQNQVIKENQKAAINFIYSFVSSVGSIFIRFILVITYIFLLLYYRSHIKAFFLKLTASNKQKEMEKLIDGATHVSQQYLLGLFKMIVCLWIMYGIGFALVGVKNPFMFAIICGLMEIVPFIGNITGTTLTVLVSAVNGASLNVLGAIVLIYGVVQFIQGWFLEPLILGPQVKINPLFTIIALVLGEIIWGIPGIILAIPITAIFKITCDHIESLKPLGFLIGEIKENKKISPLFKKSKLD